MNSRMFLYGALLAVIVVSGTIIRNAAKARNPANKELGPSLVGGIFAFPYMAPFYPASPEKAPSLASNPTLTGSWNSLSNDSQFVVMINDVGPFTAEVWVDGFPLGQAAQTVFSYPYLTVTFPGVTLATGEREVTIKFTKNAENWGFIRSHITVENLACRAYEETLLAETDALFRISQRQGELHDGLRRFQQYLLLPCRYGSINLDALKKEIEEYEKAFSAHGSEFWHIVAGKELRTTEARLALKIFRRNWDQILNRIPPNFPVVSPFVKPTMPEVARRIVEILHQRQRQEDAGANGVGPNAKSAW